MSTSRDELTADSNELEGDDPEVETPSDAPPSDEGDAWGLADYLDSQYIPPDAESSARRPGNPPAVRPRQLDPIEQFSLSQWMLLILFATVVLSGFHWLPRAWFAGLTGFAALIALRLISPAETPAIVRLGWWIVLAAYVASAGLAMWEASYGPISDVRFSP